MKDNSDNLYDLTGNAIVGHDQGRNLPNYSITLQIPGWHGRHLYLTYHLSISRMV